MPFRCKCGRTFEKTDTFASHTSACAPFHQRRISPSSSSNATANGTVDMASSMPSYFMPTGLSLQHAFEGARRRSMSYGSTNASLK
ncbi:hypothetical protein BDB00DRAFT_773460 [Zychaea mexicana]|uniref:uncharacterized protein n=1 Tax=Zychaea mexicana TaxID=64656 RepID=UPI0022FF20F2|nr:uncharacterized protein BDB00DRAFT_773460 [Zychaea mexicana]KAI9487966.1 hypothetical protein BDB00DRAFT_773460 [Zychaea mexicana]